MSEPALGYGRQYFRQTSKKVYFFLQVKSTLVYSCILDASEVLVAMNLDSKPRNNCIVVDSNLHRKGQK